MTPPATDSFWDQNKDRLLTSAILFLLLYSAVRNILKAAIRPFWFDELLTLIVARQPTLSSLWHSLTLSADGQPPPYYLLERVFDKLIPDDHIAFRLSSVFAFCLMEWCLFSWLKKRHDILVAFVASLLPLMTVLYGSYTVEARPYCLIAGCLGLALVAYQNVPAPVWTLVFGLSLVAAQAFHYYSVFIMSPFFVAEAVFYLKTRSLRWPVWCALFAGVLPILPFWPILSNLKAYYSGHFWSHPGLIASLRIYGWIFSLPQGSSTSFSWSMLVGFSLSVVVLIVSAFLLVQSLRANPNLEPYFHEKALIAAFLFLPIILYIATKLSNGGLTPRYLLPVTLGLVLAAARGLSLLTQKSLLFVGALLCLSITLQESAFWISYYGSYELGFARQKPLEQLVAQAGHVDLPVAVSDGHEYLETVHYATPQWKQRLTYLADPENAVLHGLADTTEKELLVLREITPLRVFEFDKFRAGNTKFLLYSDPTPENSPDWWVARLKADGYSLKNLATDGNSTVYLVDSSHAE